MDKNITTSIDMRGDFEAAQQHKGQPSPMARGMLAKLDEYSKKFSQTIRAPLAPGQFRADYDSREQKAIVDFQALAKKEGLDLKIERTGNLFERSPFNDTTTRDYRFTINFEENGQAQSVELYSEDAYMGDTSYKYNNTPLQLQP